MSSRRVSAIVLAAGEGTRMRSDRPKPLHVVCGRPMVMHVLHALVGLPMDRTVVVVGKSAERVTKKVQEQAPPELHVTFVEQRVQRGTGDAVIVGLTAFEHDDVDDASTVLVLPGDTPLLRPETLPPWWERTSRRATRPPSCRPGWPTPPATAGSCGAGRPGAAHRGAPRRHRRGAGGGRGQHLDLLLPPQTCSARPCAGSPR
jgi:CTP:molybdopterin cytidylyltransferase MocA